MDMLPYYYSWSACARMRVTSLNLQACVGHPGKVSFRLNSKTATATYFDVAEIHQASLWWK